MKSNRVYLVLTGATIISFLLAVPTLFYKSWFLTDISRVLRASLVPITALMLVPGKYWRTRALLWLYMLMFSTNIVMVVNDHLFKDLHDGTINKYRVLMVIVGTITVVFYYFFRGRHNGNGKNGYY